MIQAGNVGGFPKKQKRQKAIACMGSSREERERKIDGFSSLGEEERIMKESNAVARENESDKLLPSVERDSEEREATAAGEEERGEEHRRQ
ncbi:hypothetical protein HPP92_021981 [Vanilla planifolia]|uniref:Uncharacterized protein n=1 Tax=Vanilla planifolia TaxID=51239 RepID=A0A835Q287_VANPL|nr:hypothetical protein HPP92_021981 [Vanilla planifolia]